ncbi:MAG: hypothetical protein AAGI52_06690 [Bacteroidota bacterium]
MPSAATSPTPNGPRWRDGLDGTAASGDLHEVVAACRQMHTEAGDAGLDLGGISAPPTGEPTSAATAFAARHEACRAFLASLRSALVDSGQEVTFTVPAPGRFFTRFPALATAASGAISNLSAYLDRPPPPAGTDGTLIAGGGGSNLKGQGTQSATLDAGTVAYWWDDQASVWRTDWSVVGVANRASSLGTLACKLVSEVYARTGRPVWYIPGAHGGTSSFDTSGGSAKTWQRGATGSNDMMGWLVTATQNALASSALAGKTLNQLAIWNNGNEGQQLESGQATEAEILAALQDIPAQWADRFGEAWDWWMINTTDAANQPLQGAAQCKAQEDQAVTTTARWRFASDRMWTLSRQHHDESGPAIWVDSVHLDTPYLDIVGRDAGSTIGDSLAGGSPALWFAFDGDHLTFDDAALPTGVSFDGTHLLIDDENLPPGVTLDGDHFVFTDATMATRKVPTLDNDLIRTSDLGTGTASSGTVLHGDRTFKTAPAGGGATTASGGAVTVDDNTAHTVIDIPLDVGMNDVEIKAVGQKDGTDPEVRLVMATGAASSIEGRIDDDGQTPLGDGDGWKTTTAWRNGSDRQMTIEATVLVTTAGTLRLEMRLPSGNPVLVAHSAATALLIN